MLVALPLPAAPANSLPQRPLSFRLVAQMAKSSQNGKDGDDILQKYVCSRWTSADMMANFQITCFQCTQELGPRCSFEARYLT